MVIFIKDIHMKIKGTWYEEILQIIIIFKYGFVMKSFRLGNDAKLDT